MNLTDLQVELHDIESSVVARLSALQGDMEGRKLYGKPDLDIDFARISSEAAKKPLIREELHAVQVPTKKTFFAALAYLVAPYSETVEDKLYYLCRLAQGCDYQVSAEDLYQMGVEYAPQDLDSLGQYIGGLKERFMVEALVLANLTGSASRSALRCLSTLADGLDIKAHKMRDLGLAAQALLRSGKNFTTIEKAYFWAILANCRVGDIITFGSYPQRVYGEARPIEWQVLRRDDDGLLMISKYALDSKQYNGRDCSITWSQCTLRRWLNSEFINRAFDESERQQIREVHLKNSNSIFDSSVPGGSDTADKIFLLSHDEAEQMFANSGYRRCQTTAYAKKNEAWTGRNRMCAWWLRSPGDLTSRAAFVDNGGVIGYNGVSSEGGAVRPALKIAF